MLCLFSKSTNERLGFACAVVLDLTVTWILQKVRLLFSIFFVVLTGEYVQYSLATYPFQTNLDDQ